MSSETSDSEEEILVYAEFKDGINIDNHKNIHVLGIDTKNPILQLDDTFYKGKFENPMGTYMFFCEDPSPQSVDPLFDKLPDSNLQYLYKTRKFLSLQPAFITPKDGQGKETEQIKLEDSENTVPTKFNSLPEALEHFRKEWFNDNNEELQKNDKDST